MLSNYYTSNEVDATFVKKTDLATTLEDYVTINGKPVSSIDGAKITSTKFILDGNEIPRTSLQCTGSYKMQITVYFAGKTGYLNKQVSGC
jgi:hypothetical protein